MQTVTIVGFGRFGKILLKLLADDFSVVVFDTSPDAFRGKGLPPNCRRARNLRDALSSEIIFYAVPIDAFEDVISEHAPLLRRDQVVLDVLSVKVHPARVLTKHLGPLGMDIILTHPMFGPDSFDHDREDLRIVMDRFRSRPSVYQRWTRYFRSKRLNVIQMSPEQHDRLAAKSQGLTHFVGRLLAEIDLDVTPIDTHGARQLMRVRDQVSHDSWQLFLDLQRYNPYTKTMRRRLGQAHDRLFAKLLPKHVEPGVTTFGIQGGLGSFNEEALLDYVTTHRVKQWRTKYLYTSMKVLRALHGGDIDRGLFAIQNAVGGIVQETVRAMTRYNCRIRHEFSIPIRHFLMKRKDVSRRDLESVMAHDQVFRQCDSTLARRYRRLLRITGTGDYADTARAAWGVANGKISRSTAILGPRRLADLYDLEVMGEDLQDQRHNPTTFLLVSR